jgi:hypothetical protein
MSACGSRLKERCNANINSNKTCLKIKIVSKYANTKILTHNTVAKKIKAQILRIKHFKVFVRKEATVKHRTIIYTNAKRKHMATRLDQH